ncbi:protein arginine N-methyltransferase 6 isoform X2 [Cylas formicarius]|uniref:protein arginine N-methyltransferase 6 isoform X2 n=1 Tax=Cylas formicarius TaxID=197179 RepID=UPI002958B94B|nr:protein arginine N-methyltransferase 6 isoform X2 [Cylas formicarius]
MDIDEASNYFHSYEDLEIHQLMLRDQARNQSYQKAIFDNKQTFCGKIVIDVGAGTGILSVFCAQAGAQKVYAVEASDTYKIAQVVVQQNNVSNIVEVVHKKMEDINFSDIPENVDIIVSEWMGFYLLHESMLDSVIFARDHFLKPGGKMFPESATLYAAPCSLYEDWKDVSGVNMECFGRLLRQQVSSKPLTEEIPLDSLLSEPEIVTWIDLTEATVEEICQITFRHVAASTRVGSFEGICLWFTCTFPVADYPSNAEPVTLSTGPGEQQTHWKQTVIVLPESIQVETGTPICYELAIKRSTESKRRYILELTMLDANAVEHPEFCSCYMTKCILVKAMLEKYEKENSGDNKTGNN